MKYQQSSFSVAMGSAAYREGWERMFGKKKEESKPAACSGGPTNCWPYNANCARCGHPEMRHVFLLADMDRCHEKKCDCRKFIRIGSEEDVWTVRGGF